MQDYVSKLAVLLVNAKGDPDSLAGAEVQVSKLPIAKLHDAYRASWLLDLNCHGVFEL